MTDYERCMNRGANKACKKVIAIIQSFAAKYPHSVFPDPEPGCSPDRYSAAMARHVCAELIKDVSALIQLRGKDE